MSKTTTIQILTKSRKCLEIQVPAVMEVCGLCQGYQEAHAPCPCCKGQNVLGVADVAVIKTNYPKIYEAWNRYHRQEEADAWEAQGEFLLGC